MNIFCLKASLSNIVLPKFCFIKVLHIQENIPFTHFRNRKCSLSFLLTFQKEKRKKNLLFMFLFSFPFLIQPSYKFRKEHWKPRRRGMGVNRENFPLSPFTFLTSLIFFWPPYSHGKNGTASYMFLICVGFKEASTGPLISPCPDVQQWVVQLCCLPANPSTHLGAGTREYQRPSLPSTPCISKAHQDVASPNWYSVTACLLPNSHSSSSR